MLVWHELRQYLYGEAAYTFSVDRGIGHHLQINVDMTVAMPCHCGSLTKTGLQLTLHLEADACLTRSYCGCSRRSRRSTAHFRRIHQGRRKVFNWTATDSTTDHTHSMKTTFQIGQAQRIRTLKTLDDASDGSASRKLKDSRGKARFGKTAHLVPGGPACRIYGAMTVKKVTGNLHIVRSLPTTSPLWPLARLLISFTLLTRLPLVMVI